MRFVATLLFLLPFSAISVQATASDTPNWLIGKWKSNEEKTLEDLKKHPEINEEAKKLFTNNFFGRLVIIYRKKSTAWYFIDEKPEKLEFINYQTVLTENNSVTFKFFNKTLGKDTGRTIYREGNCYYALTEKWNFKEYFCRYEK